MTLNPARTISFFPKTGKLTLCTAILLLAANSPTVSALQNPEEKSADSKPVVEVQESSKPENNTNSASKAEAESKPDAESKPEAETKPDTETKPESIETAGDAIPAGHSLHGEVFNEGPRGEAHLIGGTGNIHFPATTENEQAQKFIDQGVGQLHGFWYLEAERSFRQAAMLDPQCAIAYWGAAMANHNNSNRARGFIAEAEKRKDSASKREQAYIAALAKRLKPIEEKDSKKRQELIRKQAIEYCRDLEDIIFENPDDVDAKAFLALQAYENNKKQIPIVSYYAVDALLQDIFDKQPNHPAHHYCIHLWDKRRAELALKSAANCGQSAPSIAHMWHMPGHIYSRLKRYEDAAWQQEASARVDHAHMIRQRLMPDQIFNFAHNNEWLIRNMINIGRVDDAIELARNMCSLPRHPKYNTLTKGSAHYGRQRLIDVCFKYQRWDALLKAMEDDLLEPSDSQDDKIRIHRAMATACIMTDDDEQGEKFLQVLDDMVAGQREKIKEEKDKAIEKLKKDEKLQKNEEELQKKIDAESKRIENRYAKKIEQMKKAIRAVEGYQALREEDFKKAAAQFKLSDVDKTLLLELQSLAGETEEALKQLDSEIANRKNEVIPAMRKLFILDAADDEEGSLEAIRELQKISGSIDMNSPLFKRVTEIAKRRGFEADWRSELKLAGDVGVRPPLDELGPFQWKPWQTPVWEASNAETATFYSKEIEGKPTILIFYLGHGCLHCVEQLTAFGPEMERFEEAGIELRAISSEEVKTLKESLESFDGKMQIPLLADGDHDVFKAFGAYDDFENQPLHGTFLIDADGNIRWQDIGHEPFMDHKFLLKESERLLSLASEVN